MTTAEELAWADPTDLDGLRGALSAADPEGRLAPIAMSRIEIGPEALYLLPEIVSELAAKPARGTSRRRAWRSSSTPRPCGAAASDLKEEAERLLGGRFEVRRAVIGDRGTELHADEEALAEAEAAVAGADCVVVVGSGTITDVCKEATQAGRRDRRSWWCRRPPRSTPSPTTWRCCSRAGPSAPSPRAGQTPCSWT